LGNRQHYEALGAAGTFLFAPISTQSTMQKEAEIRLSAVLPEPDLGVHVEK
jgi:hypothetical protein